MASSAAAGGHEGGAAAARSHDGVTEACPQAVPLADRACATELCNVADSSLPSPAAGADDCSPGCANQALTSETAACQLASASQPTAPTDSADPCHSDPAHRLDGGRGNAAPAAAVSVATPLVVSDPPAAPSPSQQAWPAPASSAPASPAPDRQPSASGTRPGRYDCRVPGCGKKYNSSGGLRYHLRVCTHEGLQQTPESLAQLHEARRKDEEAARRHAYEAEALLLRQSMHAALVEEWRQQQGFASASSTSTTFAMHPMAANLTRMPSPAMYTSTSDIYAAMRQPRSHSVVPNSPRVPDSPWFRQGFAQMPPRPLSSTACAEDLYADASMTASAASLGSSHSHFPWPSPGLALLSPPPVTAAPVQLSTTNARHSGAFARRPATSTTERTAAHLSPARRASVGVVGHILQPISPTSPQSAFFTHVPTSRSPVHRRQSTEGRLTNADRDRSTSTSTQHWQSLGNCSPVVASPVPSPYSAAYNQAGLLSGHTLDESVALATELRAATQTSQDNDPFRSSPARRQGRRPSLTSQTAICNEDSDAAAVRRFPPVPLPRGFVSDQTAARLAEDSAGDLLASPMRRQMRLDSPNARPGHSQSPGGNDSLRRTLTAPTATTAETGNVGLLQRPRPPVMGRLRPSCSDESGVSNTLGNSSATFLSPAETSENFAAGSEVGHWPQILDMAAAPQFHFPASSTDGASISTATTNIWPPRQNSSGRPSPLRPHSFSSPEAFLEAASQLELSTIGDQEDHPIRQDDHMGGHAHVWQRSLDDSALQLAHQRAAAEMHYPQRNMQSTERGTETRPAAGFSSPHAKALPPSVASLSEQEGEDRPGTPRKRHRGSASESISGTSLDLEVAASDRELGFPWVNIEDAAFALQSGRNSQPHHRLSASSSISNLATASHHHASTRSVDETEETSSLWSSELGFSTGFFPAPLDSVMPSTSNSAASLDLAVHGSQPRPDGSMRDARDVEGLPLSAHAFAEGARLVDELFAHSQRVGRRERRLSADRPPGNRKSWPSAGMEGLAALAVLHEPSSAGDTRNVQPPSPARALPEAGQKAFADASILFPPGPTDASMTAMAEENDDGNNGLKPSEASPSGSAGPKSDIWRLI